MSTYCMYNNSLQLRDLWLESTEHQHNKVQKKYVHTHTHARAQTNTHVFKLAKFIKFIVVRSRQGVSYMSEISVDVLPVL